MLVFLLLLCIVLCLVGYLIYDCFCYFSNRSIPSPPLSSLIYGHLSDLWSAKSYSEQLRQWSRQYGSVYGIFEGTCPVYVISDVHLIEEIFLKQFSRFHCRRTALSNRILGQEHFNVLSANVAHLWKKQRKILNPTFSGAKMKRLLPTVETCVNIFIERLQCALTKTPEINIYEVYKRLTMDVICRCAFSIDTEVQYDVNDTNIYMRKVREFFAKNFERTFLGKLHRVTSHTRFANLCPWLFRANQFLGYKTSSPPKLWLIGHMHQFIQQRHIDINEKKVVDDLLQLMINAVDSDKDQLLPTELLSNVFIILAAGYETTSTALGYCTHHLALHQDIQEKLYEELTVHDFSDTSVYETITSKLTYMDLFVREVLRMHPIAIQIVNRQCMEDTRVADYDIQKGSVIQIDVLSVHFNEELWGPEPVDEFHPERHSSKRHPLAYMPFGAGPRTCIGMRFALMEIKLCLARLIQEYRVLPSSNETDELNIEEEVVMTPEKVYVKLEKR